MKNNEQKPVKIIQIIQDVYPQEGYGFYGLGNDGALYEAHWERKRWELCIGPNFAPTPEPQKHTDAQFWENKVMNNFLRITTKGVLQKCIMPSTVVIPLEVTTVGRESFSACHSLTSIDIPESVTSIGDWAFMDCHNLTSVTLGDGLTKIGCNAFDRCRSLTSINIPSSVTSIGRRAFMDCNSLTSITIPDNVTSIGDKAFEGCESLSLIWLPERFQCDIELKRLGLWRKLLNDGDRQ